MSSLNKEEADKRTEEALIPFTKTLNVKAGALSNYFNDINGIALIIAKYAFEMPLLRFTNVLILGPEKTQLPSGKMELKYVVQGGGGDQCEDREPKNLKMVPCRVASGRPRDVNKDFVGIFIDLTHETKLGKSKRGFSINWYGTDETESVLGKFYSPDLGGYKEFTTNGVVQVCHTMWKEPFIRGVIGRTDNWLVDYEQRITLPYNDETVLLCGCVNDNTEPRAPTPYYFDAPCDKCGFTLVWELSMKKWRPLFAW